MARKRLLAPEHFKHAELYDLEVTSCLPVSRAYQGLWCHADRRGLFAWRPVDLRLEIFPYGFGVHSMVLARCQHCASTVLGMADVMAETMEALCEAGFVEYYEVEGRAYGRIPNFHRWQTFHVREKPDRLIPEPLSSSPVTKQARQHRSAVACRHGASTVPARGQHGVSTPVTGTDAGTGTKELIAADAAPADLSLVGAPKKPKTPRAPKASDDDKPKYPNFSRGLCDAMHALWVSKFGAVSYGMFRNEFGPLFTLAEADRPSDAPKDIELRDALDSYVKLAPMGDGATFVTVRRAAACLSAIANARREYANEPERRLEAVMRIIHGRQRVAA